MQGSVLLWALENATIMLPTEGRRRISPYPYQARLWMDRAPRRLILKARQTGVSNAIAIEALHKAITRPDSIELFVSRNQDAARGLITYCEHTLNGLRQLPVLIKENAGELAFANGSRIVSLPANPSTGRGIAASDVYLDEFAFCAYDALIYESIIGTVSTGGRMTILSTPNGRGNLFFRLWAGLEGGEWSRHQIHWSDCPRYDDAWAERTRASMTRQSFAQEYDLDFLTSGDAVFDPDDLARCLDGWNPDPSGCTQIINAWDIGRRRDHTVGISIGLRGDVWHEVAYERVLEPYPAVQARIDARTRRLGGTTRVESNGPGDPVLENLTMQAEPFVTTARTKVQAIQALQLLIQQGRFKFGSEQLGRELGLYQWNDAALVQDSVMAAAIAAAGADDGCLFQPSAGGDRPALGDMRHTGAPQQPSRPMRSPMSIPGTGIRFPGGPGRIRGY
jgi:Terminase large subunit, T4likevirus-type, N-terminal